MTTYAIPADGIAAVSTVVAVFVLLVYRGGIVRNTRTALVLALSIVYMFIGLSNLLENSGFLRRMDVFESSFMLLGAALFVLLFYALDAERTSVSLQESIENEKRATRSLADARDRMVRFLDTVPDPVFALTPQGVMTFANHALRVAFLPEAHHERLLHDLPVAELPTALRSLVARCPVQELSALAESVTKSLRLPDKGTGGIVYQLNAIPLRAADGRMTEVLYHIRDITQESRMLDATVQERRSRSVFALVTHITHEINNVLGGIGGVAQLLKDGDLTSDEISEYMSKVSDLVERGTKLIEDLTGATSSADRRSVALLPELMKRVEKTLNETLPAGIRLRMAVAEDLHPVEVDPDEMEVAVTNLAMNAAEASLPGGTVVIETENVRLDDDSLPAHHMMGENDFARIVVVDSGRGIHTDERGRVFDPYFTTKGMHKGMGLPVASLIVERHQGFLRLEKSDELGSAFAIYLPFTPIVSPVQPDSDTAFEEPTEKQKTEEEAAKE